MIESKWGQRSVGLLLFLLGGGFTVWSWYTGLTEGYYYQKAVAIFPAFAVLALGLIFFPMDMEKFRAEHGLDRPQRFAHYPVAWKVLIVVAVAAGLGNWLAISQW